MSPLPPPDSGSRPDTTLSNPQGGGSRNGSATLYAQTPAEIEVEIEALSLQYGIPIYRTSFAPGAVRIRALDTRRERRRFKRMWDHRAKERRKAQRKAYRRAHPWTERWPNAARVIWWSLIIATVAFFVLADRLATYLPKH